MMISIIISPDAEARAADKPVGALEAGDLMGETPRGKKSRYAESSEQTPDHKAEDIVRESFWHESLHDTSKNSDICFYSPIS